MNFNFSLDEQLSKQLTDAATNSNKSINAIVNEALSLWLKNNEKSEWPDHILAYEGMPDLPAFKSHREETVGSKSDPFA